MRIREIPWNGSALLAAVAALFAVDLFAGCGSDGKGENRGGTVPITSANMPTEPAAPPPPLQPARCPPAADNCRSAEGRIVFVERVDPDGDGDAHFVLASDESVTAPGISVVDVRRRLRPVPLPGPGDLLSAAGPVYRGSYGQRQIQADVVHVSRRGRGG